MTFRSPLFKVLSLRSSTLYGISVKQISEGCLTSSCDSDSFVPTKTISLVDSLRISSCFTGSSTPGKKYSITFFVPLTPGWITLRSPLGNVSSTRSSTSKSISAKYVLDGTSGRSVDEFNHSSFIKFSDGLAEIYPFFSNSLAN